MSDVSANDAAFGPTSAPSGVGSAAQMSPEQVARIEATKKLQMALNARGFGPIVVSGHLDSSTQDALRRAGFTVSSPPVAAELELALSRLTAPPIGPNAVFAPNVPLWKRPNFWLGAVAVAAVVGYVAYRSGAIQLSGAKLDEDDDEPELEPEVKKPTKRKAEKPKCSTSFPDFDTAEPIKE